MAAGAQVSFGSNADMATFAGAINSVRSSAVVELHLRFQGDHNFGEVSGTVVSFSSNADMAISMVP